MYYMHTHVTVTSIHIYVLLVQAFEKSMHDFYFLNLSLLPILFSSFVKCNSFNIFHSVPYNCDCSQFLVMCSNGSFVLSRDHVVTHYFACSLM